VQYQDVPSSWRRVREIARGRRAGEWCGIREPERGGPHAGSLPVGKGIEPGPVGHYDEAELSVRMREPAQGPGHRPVGRLPGKRARPLAICLPCTKPCLLSPHPFPPLPDLGEVISG